MESWIFPLTCTLTQNSVHARILLTWPGTYSMFSEIAHKNTSKSKNAKCGQIEENIIFFCFLLRIRTSLNYLRFALTWITIYFNSIWRKKHVWSSAIFSPDMAGRSGVISSGYIFAAEWKIMRALSPQLNFKQGFLKMASIKIHLSIHWNCSHRPSQCACRAGKQETEAHEATPTTAPSFSLSHSALVSLRSNSCHLAIKLICSYKSMVLKGHKWLPVIVPWGHYCPSMNVTWKYTAAKKEPGSADECPLMKQQ